MSDKNMQRQEEAAWADYMAIPAWQNEEGSPVAWAGVSSMSGTKYAIGVRVGEQLARHVEQLQEDVPGLNDSTACRLLMAIGAEVLKDARHDVPGLFPFAVRPADTPGLNAERLAAFVCPIVANMFEAEKARRA